MAFDTSDDRLPYQQVADSLREEIRRGDLGPGARMPTVAALCERFNVAKMTVERAMKELREEGLVVSWQGRGTFVRDDPGAAGGPAPDRNVGRREIDDLSDDVSAMKKQIGRLEGLVIDLYGRVGQPLPRDEGSAEGDRKKRRAV